MLERTRRDFRDVGTKAPRVCVVDDDPSVSEALSLVLSVDGFAVSAFAEPDRFLAELDAHPADCVLLDMVLPQQSGLDVLRRLSGRKCSPPVIMMSAHARVGMAVEAIKLGAIDFLEKPVAAHVLVERIRAALRQHAGSGSGKLKPFPGRELLTRREDEVLVHIAFGASNKETAQKLSISPRTVEVHRARIMDKLNARNTAELVRKVIS